MGQLAMQDTLPSMWQNRGVVLSILGAILVLLLNLVNDAAMSSGGRATVERARRMMFCALLGSLVWTFMPSRTYGEIVRAIFGYCAKLLTLLGVLLGVLLLLIILGVHLLLKIIGRKAACPRQLRLDEVNRKLLKMKDTMERQLKVINRLKATWANTIMWTGMAYVTGGLSKVVQIPLHYTASKNKRQVTKEFKLSQMKAADIYYCHIEREGGSEAGLVDLPSSGPDKLLLTKEEWLTQRGELQLS